MSATYLRAMRTGRPRGGDGAASPSPTKGSLVRAPVWSRLSHTAVPAGLFGGNASLQPRREAGSFDHPPERQSDAAAEEVLRMPDPRLAPTLPMKRACACGGQAGLHGGCPECGPPRPTAQGRLSGQAKLTVSQPGDPYEQEADRVAEQVMRMPVRQLQRGTLPWDVGAHQALQMSSPTTQLTPLDWLHSREADAETKAGGSQRQRPTEEIGERKNLQSRGTTAHSPSVTPLVEAAINSMRGAGGQPLDPSTRSFMEPRFGQRFGQVRVHNDPTAAAAARALDAHAFTLGTHLFFGDGAFRPTTPAGQTLIAHELAHMLQQRGGAARKVQRATGELPPNLLPQNCFDGAFAPQPSSALPAFESGRELAIRWVSDAQTLLGKVREGTARPMEAALARQTFAARFGDPGEFAGMKQVSHSGVAQPRVEQTAQDVVLEIVDGVARGLPLLHPSHLAGPGLPEPGNPVGWDVEGRQTAARQAAIVTTGMPVFCGRTPAAESCPATASAFFDSQDNAIGVCDSFFAADSRSRAATLIHELVHALVQPGVNDVYTHSRLFNVLQFAPGALGRPGEFALRNPDSIVEFIRVLAEGTATGPKKGSAPSDTLEGFGKNEADVRLALGFAHQRALLARDAMTDIVAGLQDVRVIVVGGAGSSSHMAWGSPGDQVRGCRIQRAFEDFDRRVASLGDPCGGGTRIRPDGVTLLQELYATYSAISQAFSAPLSVRYQPGAGADVPVLWVPGTPASLLVDDSFFALDPPARARAIILGMHKRSIPVPTGLEGTPLVSADAGVADGVTPSHIDFMDSLLAEVLPVYVGPGG